MVDRDPNQVDLLRSFGWQVYYGDAGRIDLLEQAGIAEAKLFVIAIDDPEAAVKLARLVGERWPNLPIVARARSRTDAYEFRDLGLHAVRETFHSSLEAATQALRALGEPAHSAWRMARQFEQHDLDDIGAYTPRAARSRRGDEFGRAGPQRFTDPIGARAFGGRRRPQFRARRSVGAHAAALR